MSKGNKNRTERKPETTMSWTVVQDKMITNDHKVQRDIERMRRARAQAAAFENNPAPEHFTQLCGKSFKFWLSANGTTYYVLGKFQPEVGRGPCADVVIQIDTGADYGVASIECTAKAIVDYAQGWRIITTKLFAKDESQQHLLDCLKSDRDAEPIAAEVKSDWRPPIKCTIKDLYKGIGYGVFKKHYQGFNRPAKQTDQAITTKAEAAIENVVNTTEEVPA